MFLEWENNSGKFQNNAINDVKQISLSHVIKYRKYSRFNFKNTISTSAEFRWAKFLWSDRLFFIRIGKFGSFKNTFAMIRSLFELHFRCRRFLLV